MIETETECEVRLPATQAGIGPDATDRVVVMLGSNSSRGSFHALNETEDGPKPACQVKHRSGTYDDWPLEQALAWRDPCWYCFDPDATPTGGEQ